MRYNHLSHLAGNSYPERLKILSDIGYRLAKQTVFDLVIDVRNDVEHTYKEATKAQAERAVELATLFLDATVSERDRVAIVSIGWGISRRSLTTPTQSLDVFSWSEGATPMLLIDVCSDTGETALLIYPKEAAARRCAMKEFGRAEGIALAKLLRKHYDLESFASMRLGRDRMAKMYNDLNLNGIVKSS